MIGLVGLAALVPVARAGLTGRPPGWLVEGVASPLAGVAAWLVWRRIDAGLERKRAALRRWGWLMLLAALWPAIPGMAVPLGALCLLAAGWTGVAFHRLRPLAALALLPFVAWLLRDAASVITHFWLA